jgi:hypothetical protein
MKSKNEVIEKELAEAVERVYKKYGTNLKAFFDDVNKELEERRKKPVEMWERTTVELRPSLDPKGYLIAHVMVDGQEVVSIWCNDIKVLPGKPPMYSLEYTGGGHLDIAGVPTNKMTIDSRLKGTILDETVKYLGKYAEFKGK